MTSIKNISDRKFLFEKPKKMAVKKHNWKKRPAYTYAAEIARNERSHICAKNAIRRFRVCKQSTAEERWTKAWLAYRSTHNADQPEHRSSPARSQYIYVRHSRSSRAHAHARRKRERETSAYDAPFSLRFSRIAAHVQHTHAHVACERMHTSWRRRRRRQSSIQSPFLFPYLDLAPVTRLLRALSCSAYLMLHKFSRALSLSFSPAHT